MSLLAFHHEEKSAMILTDTLATTPEGEAFMFVSKAWAIPHMNMAIAVTGAANLGALWNQYLRNSLIARDIEMVDRLAPAQLRRLWSEVLEEHGIVGAPTVTMYHFGFPEGSEHLVRYVYRSTENFESERSEQACIGVKPVPEGQFETPEDLDGWVALAERVRAEQDARPAADRVHIGGEFYVLHLRNWQSMTMRLHRFEDYEQTWLDMNKLLQREHDPA